MARAVADLHRTIDRSLWRQGLTGCWESTLTPAALYPRINIDGRRNTRVLRIQCERYHGPAPVDGMDVCHSCDNKRCCNPRHLRWGTRSDNVRDAVARGQHVSPKRTLTADQVREIRATPNVTRAEWARRLGVDPTTISQAARGLSWKELT